MGTEPAATSKGSRMFSEKEIQYLKSQRLVRIATAFIIRAAANVPLTMVRTHCN
ncbi:MAG TPA: hypothetical protein VE619_09400 [Nitrososphaeraceae archaeon]|nr:hypothetical protein [Nitrososphaeraceae archaeon]